MAFIGEERAAGRREVFLGWVTLESDDVKEVFPSIGGAGHVVSSPSVENPYHSEILLPAEWDVDAVKRGLNVQYLMDNARWKERPGLELLR